MAKLWVLSAWHKKICETSVFLLSEECLSISGFDDKVSDEDLHDYYFGSHFGKVDVVKLEVVSGELDTIPLEMELRPV